MVCFVAIALDLSYHEGMSIHFGAVLIHVSDLARAKRWFEDVLRLVTVEYDPEYLFLKMRSEDVIIYVEAPNPQLAHGLNAHAVGTRSQAVFHVDDLRTEMRRLEALGVKVIIPPTEQYYGGFDAVIADPDGNEFILHEKNREDE